MSRVLISSTPVQGQPRPILSLPGVGQDRALVLGRLGITTVEDLLLHRPRRYEDRRIFSPIRGLPLHEPVTTRGKIVAMGVKRFQRGLKSVFEMIVEDGTARLHCRWWNLPFMQNYFEVGDELFIHGKLISFRPRTMDHPETEVLHQGEEPMIHLNRIVPVYPLTEGLPQRWLRSLMFRTVDAAAESLTYAHEERLGPEWLRHSDAIRKIHFPEHLEEAERARQRLGLEEFIELQMALQRRRQKLEAGRRGLPCRGDNRWMKPFLKSLGFQLTEAQKRVLREMRKDLSGEHPMRRLLQGDVGSGKTAVAACSALMALESGFQVVLMAPTQILAEQHFQKFQQWLEPLGIRVILLTGPIKSERADPAHPELIVGTHALLESGFEVRNLGLVIIDEQHKFGVAQRETLLKKGSFPHLLVMTATPIPRTLGLTLYGDLDLSVIDELPPNRGHVETRLSPPGELKKVLAFVRRKLEEGRQAYIVYSRIEESEKITLKGATCEWEQLSKDFAPFQVGLLHGRVSQEEREQTMRDFRSGKISVLMATSVIEVGVDVPNATVMVIENADQFGLAQLHQLRGRIGRGGENSFCILMAERKSEEARLRLEIMARTHDGFEIAEEDLKLRGPGEFLGRDQSGMPQFRFGELGRDLKLVEAARSIASTLLAEPGASS